MAKTQMKTTKNKASVVTFLNTIENEQRRKDGKQMLVVMKEITKAKPRMWGDSIVGFGEYSYSRKDGSQHTFPVTGFSPRKQALTVYSMPGFSEYTGLMAKLGKHTHSSSCLYIKKLEDIHLPTLKKLIRASIVTMKKNYPVTF